MPRIAALFLLLLLPFQGGCLYYSCSQRDKFHTGTAEDHIRIVIDRHHTADVDAMMRVHFAGIPPFIVLNGMFGPRNCATFSSPSGDAVVTLSQAERFTRKWHRQHHLVQPAFRGDPFPAPTRAQLAEDSLIRRNPQSAGSNVAPLTSVLVSAEPFVIAVAAVPKLTRVSDSRDLRETRFDRLFVYGSDSKEWPISAIRLPQTVTISTELPLADTIDFYIDQRPRTATTLEAPSEPGTFVVLRDARGRAILRLHREESILRVRPAEPSDDEV